MDLKIRIVILIGLVILCSACSQKESHDGTAICHEFYSLNKDKDLSFLRKYQILVIREYSVYNENNKKYDIIPEIGRAHV